MGSNHGCSAEAITNSTVIVTKRSTIISQANRDPHLAQQILMLMSLELQRVQSHMLVLIKKAQERMVTFLLEMAEHTEDNDIYLPMSRQYIADYLGLTIETVSRTLTQLENEATIALPSTRRVVLRDRQALNRLTA